MNGTPFPLEPEIGVKEVSVGCDPTNAVSQRTTRVRRGRVSSLPVIEDNLRRPGNWVNVANMFAHSFCDMTLVVCNDHSHSWFLSDIDCIDFEPPSFFSFVDRLFSQIPFRDFSRFFFLRNFQPLFFSKLPSARSFFPQSGLEMEKPELCRYMGVVLAAAIGDALGAGVEMLPADSIQRHYTRIDDFMPPEKQLFPDERKRPFGSYTDDTESTLALVASLCATNGMVNAQDVAQRSADMYHEGRGYCVMTHQIVMCIKAGVSALETGTLFRPSHISSQETFFGNDDNGAAMKISPLGLLPIADQDDIILRSAVRQAVIFTHSHPVAIDAAVIQAKAVQILSRAPLGKVPDDFLLQLLRCSQTLKVREKLLYLSQSMGSQQETEVVDTLIGFDGVQAEEAISVALCAFLHHVHEPQVGVLAAVNYGGDCDTIASLTGALFGALHGDQWLKPSWVSQIENSHGLRKAAQSLFQIERLSLA